MNAIALGADAEAVSALLNGKANVRYEDDQNRDPLFIAAEHQSVSPGVIELLIKAGAEVDGRDALMDDPAYACMLKQ